MRTWAVAVKELRQIRRDARTLVILIFVPAFFLFLYGYALNFDIRHVAMAVEDRDGTADFSFEDEDFNVRSLIGNAVLRWEYRPGSTVFFVWQRQQMNQVGVGDFDFGRDWGALFGAPAENRFIVKVNYWLGL